MTFVLHRGERADVLADALAELLAVPPADPFTREVVAVHSRGVERWLSHHLAARLGTSPGRADGVCANLHFPFPGRLVGDVLADVTGVDRDTDPWRPERLTWPLLEVVEGNEPLPREPHYPPYEKGLFATPLSPNPALVNNAETFAHVPGIVAHGAESFRRLGTANTPGTCLYTLSGDVRRPGSVAVDPGASATVTVPLVGVGRRYRLDVALPELGQRIHARCPGQWSTTEVTR